MPVEAVIQKLNLEPDPEKMRDIRRITWVGLLVNALLVLVKFAGGYFGKSQAVIADAVHSLSDNCTDVAILVGVKYWSRPPDKCHPYGHKRIETLVTFSIGLILCIVAAALTYNALVTMSEKHTSGPNWIAFIAAIASIISKEVLYHWTVVTGKKHNSPAVVANAWHHRSDALSSIPAALAVLVAALYPKWIFVDHVGAVIVSFFILQAAGKIMLPALKEMVDAGASARDYEKIKTLTQSIPGIEDVHAIRTRFLSSGLQVDLHITVNGSMTVKEGHDISEKVQALLLKEGPDVLDVVVHVEPPKANPAGGKHRDF